MDKEKIIEVIRSKRRERKYVEEMELGSIIAPAILMHGWDVYIYGCRNDTIALLNYLKWLGIAIDSIFDRDSDKIGKKIYGINVRNIDEINKIEDPDNTFLLINIHRFDGFRAKDIFETISNSGIKNFYVIKDTERLNINTYNNDWTECGRDEYYKAHEELLLNTFERLVDEISRETMIEYIRRYTEYGVYHNISIDGRLKYFFGYDNERIEYIYSHKDDEVWLNCGANIGDSIFLFFQNGLSAKKILAYEGNADVFRELKSNLRLLPEQCAKKVVPINEMINDNTDFDRYLAGNEKITLINADIEGAEEDLLKALTVIIRRDRPVIAISAYHRASDLIILPKQISEIANDYVIKIRKYESSARDISRSSELVIYGIPPERDYREDWR